MTHQEDSFLVFGYLNKRVAPQCKWSIWLQSTFFLTLSGYYLIHLRKGIKCKLNDNYFIIIDELRSLFTHRLEKVKANITSFLFYFEVRIPGFSSTSPFLHLLHNCYSFTKVLLIALCNLKCENICLAV